MNYNNIILLKLQILDFRNKIFHSASLSLTTEELEKYIDLMISVLQDKKQLEQDPQAQTAVLKLEQVNWMTLV